MSSYATRVDNVDGSVRPRVGEGDDGDAFTLEPGGHLMSDRRLLEGACTRIDRWPYLGGRGDITGWTRMLDIGLSYEWTASCGVTVGVGPRR